jgi:regulator of PEP synthase PpsR (kinase-PPPase family)
VGGSLIPIVTERPIIYIVSDSVGDTAEFVVRAAISQFNGTFADIRRVSHIDDYAMIDQTIEQVRNLNVVIVLTMVVDELKNYLIARAAVEGIPVVDIMGPMIIAFEDLYKKPAKQEPGLVRKLDEEYFKKIAAVEFAVKYDDGKDPRGIYEADIVLIGVSRTSKTPLSMYLANQRLKTANVPLVPEVVPPPALFEISNRKVIGLTINPEKLFVIREERLKSLGLITQANYASLERILEEIEYAEGIMKRICCPVIDVSNKAIEEIASIIIDINRKRGDVGE